MRAYRDRREAGAELASRLSGYAGQDVIVLALPRGGVPVAFEVARALAAPLDVFIVRKLGVPGHEELAMGAIASGGAIVLNRSVIDTHRIPTPIIEAVARREAEEIVRREQSYRDDRPPPRVEGRTVILVDDGLATGATMQAAVKALRRRGVARLVVAVPIGSLDTCAAMDEIADDVVCARTPEPFRAVGLWYDDFTQTSDEEVRSLLAEVSRPAIVA
jgi:putative phosphoribosyl transferase